MMTRYFYLFAAVILLLPVLGFAQPEAPVDQVNTFDDVACVFDRVINWIFSVLILLAVAFVFIAAYKYLFAAGNPESVKDANKMIMYAAIAMAVALLAWSLPALMEAILGIDFDVPSCNGSEV